MGRSAGPALERAREIALVRETQQIGDLGDRELVVAQVLFRQPTAGAVENFAITRILGSKLPVQRAGAAIELTGDAVLVELP